MSEFDLTGLAAAPYGRAELERLVETLRVARAEELDRWLQELGLQALLRRAPQPWRGLLLRVLGRERLGDLSVGAKARLIRALQEGPTPRRFEEAIRDCFLCTRGAELSSLKRLVDSASSSYHDLVQLLYHDVDVRSIREEILAHFDREAGTVEHRELKVLSDVDDTLYANWVDRRYPRKTVYPGVRRLYLELDRGSEARPSPLGDVAFLTGRPGDRFGWLGTGYHRNFAGKGLENTVILTGTLLHQFLHPLIFGRKWARFQIYRRLFLDFDFVLFGDSGQADPTFLEAAVKAHPDQVKAALIHDVRATPAAGREDWGRRGVVFFDTYVGAALELYRRGLLEVAALRRVVEEALREFQAVAWESAGQQRAREAEMARDVGAVAREVA